jgi:HPt (histidine-containing phosphotransfer) domain-containing protein
MSPTTVFRPETIDSLRHQLGDGGGDLVTELISLYLVQAGDLVGQIESAGRASDLSLLRAAAHKLRGSTATLGGDRLAAACQRIEGTPASELDVDDAIQQVRRELGQLSAELAAYRSALRGEPGSPEHV